MANHGHRKTACGLGYPVDSSMLSCPAAVGQPSDARAGQSRAGVNECRPCGPPPSSIVGMEACLSAHFVSRALRQLGHQPKIIPAIYVKPFEGTEERLQRRRSYCRGCPAAKPPRRAREDARPVRPPGPASSSLPPVSRRTATINQIHAFLIEQGIAVGTRAALCVTPFWRSWKTDRTRYRRECAI